MAATFTFDGLDLNASPYSVTYSRMREFFRSAARRHRLQPLALAPGGVLTEHPPGPRAVTLGGHIVGSLSAGAFETNLDALLKVLNRPRKRLVAGFLDGRYILATLAEPVRLSVRGESLAEWEATFLCEDAFWSAATPSGSVDTPTLAATPDGTAYRASYSLTPGGSARTPLRVLIAQQSGSAQATKTVVRNATMGPQRLGSHTTAKNAGTILLLDGERRKAYDVNSGTVSLVGWWPFEDASGTAKDFSSNSRDLTATNGPGYLADGKIGGATSVASPAYWDSASAGFAITGNVSLCAWVYATSIGALAGILGKGELNKGYFLGMSASNLFHAKVGDGAAVRTATGITTVETGKWYFVAMTFATASGTVSLYVGTETRPPALEAATAGGALTISTAANNFRVGRPHNPTTNNSEQWTGRIDEAAVFSATLTQAQLVTIWKEGIAGLGTAYPIYGAVPDLDPTIGTTNLIQLDQYGASAPTPRVCFSWRSRWE